MFVRGNTFKDVQDYFVSRLADLFSKTELQLMLKHIVSSRLKINEIDFLLTKDSIRFSESDLLHIRSVVKRLLNNEPFQYIVAETEFYGVVLKVDHRALIPRPETEELVAWILKDTHGVEKVVDLCSGSGCIGLAIKSQLQTAEVILVEYSNDAISLIRENAHLTGLKVAILQLDVLKKDSYTHFKNVDVIVSNPPYIPEKDRAEMSANVLEYEPDMALFVSNDDPLIFYREIAINGFDVLTEGGRIFFEIHERLGEEVVDLMKGIGFVNIELRKDLQGKDRMIAAQKVISRHG